MAVVVEMRTALLTARKGSFVTRRLDRKMCNYMTPPQDRTCPSQWLANRWTEERNAVWRSHSGGCMAGPSSDD